MDYTEGFAYLDPFEWGATALKAKSAETAFSFINKKIKSIFGSHARFFCNVPLPNRFHVGEGSKYPSQHYLYGQALSEEWEAFTQKGENASKDPIAIQGMKTGKTRFIYEDCHFYEPFDDEQKDFARRYFEHGLKMGIIFFDADIKKGRFDGFNISAQVSVRDSKLLERSVLPRLRLAYVHFCEGIRLRELQKSELRSKLSHREKDCLAWLALGSSVCQIADKTNLAESTVSEYIQNAKRKLGTSSRTQACARALMLSVIQP